MKLAKVVLAKKWGVLQVVYKKLLVVVVIQAIKKLSKVTEKKKRKQERFSNDAAKMYVQGKQEAIGDYKSINIMHSIAKIMATRLAPHLGKLVSHSQSVFIKGRSIHDNFQYVKGAVNHFHNAKRPCYSSNLHCKGL
jgi:hypothetical protein